MAKSKSQSKNLASPFSTGGGGDDFQSKVGAFYLASLLAQHVPRGLDNGTLDEVRFQRLYDGEPLDDLICVADTTTGQAKLALQIKHDLTFGQNDVFNQVMAACWQTYNSPEFDRDRDRFGIVLGLYQKKIDEHYQNVLSWARNSSSADDFLKRIGTKGLSHKNHREFEALIRSSLNAASGEDVSDDDLWGFLRSMVILHFDLLKDGSRDYNNAVNWLGQLLRPGPGAVDLFTRLYEISSEGNSAAGGYTFTDLLSKVQADFHLQPARNCREDLDKFAALRNHILEDIRSDIGGLTLNRVEVVDSLAGHQFGKEALLLLIGPPGVGKSSIWKKLVERHCLEGSCMVFSANRIDGQGWTGFAHSQGITRSAEELLLAMSTHPHPCIFIDGIDQIIDNGARRTVNDILRTAEKVLPTVEGRRRWWCIATAREDSQAQLKWLDNKVVKQTFPGIKIEELIDTEVQLVLDQNPRLKPLLSQDKLKPILKKPFLLNLLTDQRMTGGEADNFPDTEVGVSNV